MTNLTAALIRAALAVVLCGMAARALAQDPSSLPKVRVVATGGTIAGEQQQPGRSADTRSRRV